MLDGCTAELLSMPLDYSALMFVMLGAVLHNWLHRWA